MITAAAAAARTSLTPTATTSTITKSISPATLQRLHELRFMVFDGKVTMTEADDDQQPPRGESSSHHLHLRTAGKVMGKPLQAERIRAHWQVQEIWDWPRASESLAPWRDLKKESIQRKIQALGKRGKGPMARGGTFIWSLAARSRSALSLTLSLHALPLTLRYAEKSKSGKKKK